MPKKKKSKHQLAQIKRFKEQEAIDKNARKILDIWGKEYENRRGN